MSSSKSSHAGAIAGGVVGGVIFLGLIAGLAFLYRVRQRSGSQPTPASYGAFDTPDPSSVGAMSQQRILSPAPTVPTILSSQSQYHVSEITIELNFELIHAIEPQRSRSVARLSGGNDGHIYYVFRIPRICGRSPDICRI
jgi:hypothetical protein